MALAVACGASNAPPQIPTVEVRRQTIASQIEATRWRDYAEVPKA